MWMWALWRGRLRSKRARAERKGWEYMCFMDYERRMGWVYMAFFQARKLGFLGLNMWHTGQRTGWHTRPRGN